MVSTGWHPKKEISDALRRARDAGFDVEEIHRGHRWGRVVCRSCGDDLPVPSTPRDAGNAAKRIDWFQVRHRHT